MKTPQLSLLSHGKPSSRCRLCQRPHKGARRCKVCDKGDIPIAGKPAYLRWWSGLRETVRKRLEERGLGALVWQTQDAVFLDRGAVPLEARALVADIVAMPCSPRRYRRAVDRAVCAATTYDRLRADGMAHELAEELSQAAAEELYPRDVGPRVRIAVESPRLRIAPLEGSAEDLEELAREEQAESEAAELAKLRVPETV